MNEDKLNPIKILQKAKDDIVWEQPISVDIDSTLRILNHAIYHVLYPDSPRMHHQTSSIRKIKCL